MTATTSIISTTTPTTTTSAPTITSITGTSGTLYSVNYPSNYFDDYEEQYNISVEDGSKISLYSETFYLEYHVGCIYDYVEVYDSDDNLIVKACGKANPVPITSSSNNLKLIFRSDSSRNSTGFNAVWTTENNINSIQSPNYPGIYPTNITETWNLAVSEGQSINITILFLDIESPFDGTCPWDWLEIEDEKYCGEGELETPFIIITSTNNVNVTFVSDEIFPRSGFLAIWKPTTVSNKESARHKPSGLEFKDSQTDKGKEGGKRGKGRKGQGKGRK